MEQEAEDLNEEVTQWVTFRLEGEKYGIDVMLVREVLRESEIAPVPGAPHYVLGIINLRGNVVPVIDTRRRFGLPPREMDEDSRIIIVELAEQWVGMVVDAVAEVMDVPASEIERTPDVGNEDESSKFIQGVSRQDEELLILVALDRLFAIEEWAEAQP